jgi:hypothetical protein
MILIFIIECRILLTLMIQSIIEMLYLTHQEDSIDIIGQDFIATIKNLKQMSKL